MTGKIYEIFDLQLPSANFTVYLNTKYKARRGRYDRGSHTWITNDDNQEVNLHIPVLSDRCSIYQYRFIDKCP